MGVSSVLPSRSATVTEGHLRSTASMCAAALPATRCVMLPHVGHASVLSLQGSGGVGAGGDFDAGGIGVQTGQTVREAMAGRVWFARERFHEYELPTNASKERWKGSAYVWHKHACARAGAAGEPAACARNKRDAAKAV